MPNSTPTVVVIAGPNGAGKSTIAPAILRDELGIPEFVNADAIALGLAAFDPEGAAVSAGRVMLSRLRELAAARANFAFETTLASRSFAPWLNRLRGEGYTTHLFFVWLETPDLAILRVAERVRSGGHHIPDDVVRRRYSRGIRNLFDRYMPIMDSWRIYNNSASPLQLVAARSPNEIESVSDPAVFESMRTHRIPK